VPDSDGSYKKGDEMTGFRTLILSVPVIVVAGFNVISLDAQAPSPASQPASITVSVALERDRLPVGQKPLAAVTIRNISDRGVCLTNASLTYRVHVEGKDGEPPMTEFYRHLHGEYRPGDGPTLTDGPVICRPIAAGSSNRQQYDLTTYYDLGAPGKYSVYIEIQDPLAPLNKPLWLRTNTAKFEVVAQAGQ
jgi:hypothetical protein